MFSSRSVAPGFLPFGPVYYITRCVYKLPSYSPYLDWTQSLTKQMDLDSLEKLWPT